MPITKKLQLGKAAKKLAKECAVKPRKEAITVCVCREFLVRE